MVSRRRMTTKRKSVPRGRAASSMPARKRPTTRSSRKKPVKKAVTTRRRNMAGRAAGELAAFHNPFTKLSQQPRIPDGKATSSLGVRCQSVKNFKVNHVDSNGLSADTMHIFLFPGVSSSVVVYNTPVPHISQSQNRDFYVMGYKDHAPMYGPEGYDWWKGDGTIHEGVMTNTKQISKWRLVSAGLKLSLINNDESNDGWFEAVRINNCMAGDDFMMTTMNNSFSSFDTAVVPSLKFAQGIKDATSLVEEQSYQTGLLKDIHKYTFNLHPTTDQIEFKTLQEKYNFNNMSPDDTPETSARGQNDIDQPSTVEGENKIAYFDSGSQRGQSYVNQMCCRDHDMIYIRVHGRSSTSANDVSQLLLHATSNYEVMYDANNDFSKFQIKGENHPQIDKHVQAKKDEGSDAMNIL